MPTLSILILTHNRPHLFDRCIHSVLRNLPKYQIEILVNNDTNDITEIYDDRTDIGYSYEKSTNLSDIYRGLFEKAQGKFVFFLEDDDYILPCFFDELDLSYDINFVNFMAHDPRIAVQRAKREFMVDEEQFQLSQLIFSKAALRVFPNGNNIHNDWVLFQSLNGSMVLNKRPLWVQTTDGKDNISFEKYNTDDRFATIH